METAGNKEFDEDTEKKGLGNSGNKSRYHRKTDLFPVCHPKRKTDSSNRGWKSPCGDPAGLPEICKYDCRMGKPAALDGAWRDCTGTVYDRDQKHADHDAEWMRCDFRRRNKKISDQRKHWNMSGMWKPGI